MAIAVTVAFSQNEHVYNDRVLTQIHLFVYKIAHDNKDEVFEGNFPSRAPMKTPTIGFDGQNLYLYCQFGELTLELLDNGTTIYSTAVQANADEVALPCMPVTYELRLCDGRFIYSCEIELGDKEQ